MSISKGMDKEAAVDTYKRILLSHKKGCIWVSSSEVDEPRACYTEWSQSERDNQILYINTFTWASLIAQLVRIRLQCRRPQLDSWVGKIHWRRDTLPTPVFLGFPGGSDSKEICLQCRRPRFNPCVKKIPWRMEWLPTPVFWPREFHGL